MGGLGRDEHDRARPRSGRRAYQRPDASRGDLRPRGDEHRGSARVGRPSGAFLDIGRGVPEIWVENSARRGHIPAEVVPRHVRGEVGSQQGIPDAAGERKTVVRGCLAASVAQHIGLPTREIPLVGPKLPLKLGAQSRRYLAPTKHDDAQV